MGNCIPKRNKSIREKVLCNKCGKEGTHIAFIDVPLGFRTTMKIPEYICEEIYR